MKVLLDETPCEIDAANIGEAVAAVVGIAEQSGRLVVEVLVDGNALSEDDLQESTRLESKADEIQVLTTTMETLLHETFIEAVAALEGTAKSQTDAARLLQSGDASGGMNELVNALETWTGIRDAVVKGLELAELDPRGIDVDGIPLTKAISDLQGCLETLKNTMIADDLAATCDCLLYDLPPVNDAWSTVLAGLARRFKDDSSRPASS